VYDGTRSEVGGEGKPVRIRRGPATVTGESHPHGRRARPSHCKADGRPGRHGSRHGPGSQETCLRPQSPYALVERGGSVRRRIFGLVAVVAVMVAASAAPATAATVTVRVQGGTGALVPRTTVVTSPGTFTVRGGGACPSDSAGGALQAATGGDWGGAADPTNGQAVETIKGETYSFGAEFNGRFWAVFLNNVLTSRGICDTPMQDGDELLLEVACSGATTGCYFGHLDLRAPATVRPGEPFTVHVEQYVLNPATFEYVQSPSAGAVVTSDAGSATTNVSGDAAITLSASGPTTVSVTRAGADGPLVPDDAKVCVTNGSDGSCGTKASGGGVATGPGPVCATTGDDGLCGTKDRRAPRGKLTSIRNGQRFAKGKGPRVLRGEVGADPSGIGRSRLRLERVAGGKCSTYNTTRERFLGLKRCGIANATWFSVSTDASWSYLLPERLPRGRYVLDLRARDRAGNVDTQLERSRTRVVFTVS
jgi:hypothetical protein